ncbi:guanylate kinase [Streptomyces sp. NBC_00873]|uniref:guanylate kinase n=1 Tax=unclassified Streptomyces TaxID=2593676 RepID=UPI003870025B|nr:guanylate kinase [Streptomyces sp. NBC_00873]WTA47547.1 guanylate kinase [Streptomyces sp. NBC_00842]
MSAIVLYGPPTAGKDTVTAALCSADPRFESVTKLKHGTGRSAGYRFVTAEELDDLRHQGRIVAETRRYGNIYAVDDLSLTQPQERGRIPITHIGNVTDMRTLLDRSRATSWLRVLLWVPRNVCEARSRERGDTDTPKRLTAWDETAQDVLDSDVRDLFDLVVRTDRTDSETAARQIAHALDGAPDVLGTEELFATLGLGTDGSGARRSATQRHA